MTMHYKIELGPNALQMRFRAVVDAPNADAAIAAARARFPLLAKAGCSFQALDAKELQDVERAAEYFVERGDWRPLHLIEAMAVGA